MIDKDKQKLQLIGLELAERFEKVKAEESCIYRDTFL